MWLVTGYFTKDPYYSKHAKNLIESLKKFKLPYEIVPIEDYEDWFKGMQYKPTFLSNMLKKYYPHSIVYVDVDAIFCRYPDYFDILDKDNSINLAVHVLDHSKYRRKNQPPELLSGTIFLRNTEKTSIIIRRWIEECAKDDKLWDQRALANILTKEDFHILPEEYCVIFDYMRSVQDPVVKHFQASRETRTKSSLKKKSRIKVVENNGIVKLGRIYNA